MQKQKLTRKSKITLAIIAGVFIVLLIICDLIGLGGNIRYYANWIKCGHKPLVIDGPFMNVGEYSYSYRTGLLYDGYYSPSDPYFCTARDAELHGYSANHSSFMLKEITWDELRESYKQNHGKPGYEILTEWPTLGMTPEEARTYYERNVREASEWSK